MSSPSARVELALPADIEELDAVRVGRKKLQERMELGRKIASWREDLGLSESDIANELGWQVVQVAQLEMGDPRAEISQQTLMYFEGLRQKAELFRHHKP